MKYFGIRTGRWSSGRRLMPTTDSLLPESPHFDSAALEQALQMPEVGWAEEERDEDDES